jgi:nanoRNase/pAp phosphatase (c-di-AMP/oligoRNAs hydrolase)
MAADIKQVAEKLNSSGSILIILPPSPTPDAVAAGLALASYLKRLEKDAVVVSADGKANSRMDFLPGYSEIAHEINLSKGFVINVSTKRTEVGELSYKKEGGKLAIHLKAKSGEFLPEDVTFGSSKFPYDAVVVLGAPSLEELGTFYGQNADLFFETPVINIDFKGANQGYGQFNLIELNASSLSEILYDLINEIERDLVDSSVATSLLAGIIAETNSFQHSRTTPQSFMKASQLISLGGNQQDIVNRLYKNKSMGFLKLWGRVLARLKHESDHALAYSAVNRLDLEKAGATEDDAAAILKEMQQQLGFAKIFVFFIETDARTTEVFATAPISINLQSLFFEFQPQSPQPQTTKLTIGMSLASAQERVLETLRKEAQKLS